MNYQGYYINLDRRPDRRAEIEAELARQGLGSAYRRFSAADGNAYKFANPHLKDGEMGCFTSHYMLLKENLGQTKHLHIIEDDVLFSAAAAQVINSVVDQDLFSGCDILYTDIWMPIQNSVYKAFKGFYDATATRDAAGRVTHKNFNVIDLKDTPFGSMSSYLVNKNSIRKLHDLYAHEIANAPQKSIDLFIRDLAIKGTLKVGCLFPFVTSVRLDEIVETDIVRPYHEKSALAVHNRALCFLCRCRFRQMPRHT